ncbi:hypothetical protein KTR66_08095 [Roseococcus sp. SDR]|uniref:hypothetical protein n=1 Tax=Roseococcus sp. SDR TaxID=2835532 RepID=UPI001BCAE342|nr:hypothetical protein [Roseococcus sp. SDR]MBS7789951.1 hypothetical protein [Roseococcus sp. SDR]MBV1845265.1 hypothetical protein [Roseococcus sp. SDR]
MKTVLSALGAALLSCALMAPTAQAQRRDEKVGRVGNVDIVRVWEGGRFDRCYGLVPGIEGGFRVFWNVGRNYIITAPGVGTGQALAVAVTTPRGMVQTRGQIAGGRTVVTLNNQEAQQIMSLRGRFEVDVQGTIFPYQLQGTTMEQVFVAVENCAHRNRT